MTIGFVAKRFLGVFALLTALLLTVGRVAYASDTNEYLSINDGKDTTLTEIQEGAITGDVPSDSGETASNMESTASQEKKEVSQESATTEEASDDVKDATLTEIQKGAITGDAPSDSGETASNMESTASQEKKEVSQESATTGEAFIDKTATAQQMAEETATQLDAKTSGRQVISLNTGWQFTTNDSTTDGWGFPDGRSSGTVDLPHSWEYVHPVRSYIPAFNKKTATYTREIDLASVTQKQLFIKFYGVSKNAEVLIDGQTVGTHVGGYSAFAFDITDYVQGKSTVMLTVNVTNVDTDSIPINVDYTQWAGIYRDVELIAVEDVHLALDDYGSNGVYVDYTLKGTTADVSIRTGWTNDSAEKRSVTLINQITDASGAIVLSETQNTTIAAADSGTYMTSLKLDNVHLWNGTSDPYLYTLTTIIQDAEGNELDRISQKIGFRTFEIKNGKAYLNGEVIEIHGVGYHQDREGYGNAVSSEQIASDINEMLEMGVNFVRAAHYPHDRVFYELANEKGLLVYDEIPYYMIYSKAQSYGDSIKNQLKEMIRQHYNYACVVMSGIQNEVIYNSSFAQYGPDFDVSLADIVAFNQELASLAQTEDPSRLIVQATIDGYSNAYNSKQWSDNVDLTGLNFYIGFKSAVDSAGAEGREKLKQSINEKINNYKNIYGVSSLMISEYGAGGNVAQHMEVDDSFSWDGDSNSSNSYHYEEYQSFLLETYWDVISSRNDVPVSSVWNMFDFSCYRNEGGLNRINTKGLLCYDHATRKDAYYFFKAVWNKIDSFVWLTSKDFTERNRANQTIKAYSNCDSVELFLNGESMGFGSKTQDGVFVWENVELVGDVENSLKVVAKSDGVVYEDSVDGITAPSATLTYKTHLSNLGWQNSVYAGQTSGTTGKGIPVEAFDIDLGDSKGTVIAQAHVADLGWQDWTEGSCGTIGQSKRMEAIRLLLNGDVANDYDIYYRVHSAEYGWLDWAKNGAAAGTTGKSKAIEAIQVILVKKGKTIQGSTAKPFVGTDTVVNYAAHVANIGWQSIVSDGAVAGTTGRGLSMEALNVSLSSNPYAVELSGHVSNVGWQDWKTGSCGTTGQSRQLEAVKIRLKGDDAEKYDIYYRVHSANFGWLDWAKNGESAGTQGYGYGMQAIEIRIVKKGGEAPGDTTNAFRNSQVSYSAHVANIGWMSAVHDGITAGTEGRSLAVEALSIAKNNVECEGSIEYRAHVATLGWQEWVSDGDIAGTTGKNLAVEAIEVRLTGELAEKYQVRYRTHVQNIGWMDWVEDGETAGTTGRSLRVEAIQLELVLKNPDS